jgi:hypothetical protein
MKSILASVGGVISPCFAPGMAMNKVIVSDTG